MYVIVDIRDKSKLTADTFDNIGIARAVARELGDGFGGVMLAKDWKRPY